MSADTFESITESLRSEGAFIHPALQRKTINGVPGIYCDNSISAGEKLMSIPRSSTVQFKSDHYPPNTSLAVKVIHSCAQLVLKNEATRIRFMLDTLEELKASSCFFYTDDDIAFCRSMSPTLGKLILDSNAETQAILDALSSFDSSIPSDLYLEAILNYRSRALGQNGFVPAAVGFNHSVAKGLPTESTNDSIVIRAKQDFNAEDQLFISYGHLDLLKHATSYNYYDETDEHVIQLRKRFAYPIKDISDQQLAQTLASNYAISPKAVGMFKGFAIDEADAYFTMEGASSTLKNMADVFKKFGKAKTPESFLVEVLESLQKQNRVSNFTETDVPEHLLRFFHALKKEAVLIEKNLRLLAG